ncbi:transcriptional regulator NrdR [Ammoniphilus oxalaticus]|uniref:Transcriptional repressor NrdR n=1 Tax=Ammoniphilus oxalaticus TaxID=66863 RepID=A0A419SIL1_9BACL|nr:transcriptional regulator NrdR [Ammoniphilus oxalaticus]RKD23797.1 transcriptional regulator NrdR [Ammoniphilus oxalaticus]
MRCPLCQYNGTRVLDSRPVNDARSVRRRRECEDCGNRFTTFEMVEETPLLVVKKDGTREEFNREKVLHGLVRACEKRPVPIETLENIVDKIGQELRSLGRGEVNSQDVGELVMRALYDVDEVSYVRFASVYRQFKDINVFIEELEELLSSNKNKTTL